MSDLEAAAFTHLGAGTPATAWQGDPRWGAQRPLGLAGVSRLVVVAAHPDDETLGAGGLIATASAAGLAVHVVCATDGEGSHPNSPTHTPETLAVRRAAEGRAAAAALGVPASRLTRLGLADGGVEKAVAELTRAIVEVVGDGRDTVLAAPWREDAHPDHEAAGRSAAAAARRTGARLWEFPIWFWHWGDPGRAPWERLRPFALSSKVMAAKRDAVRAHASQVAPLSALPGDETLLPDRLLAHFAAPVEHFVVTEASACPDDALEQLHRDLDDPWGVETRFYEQRKRELVLAMLPRARFAAALEVGCSTGALAESLAPRCGRLLAVDRSVSALAAARERLRGLPDVTVADLDVPSRWPDGERFDLVVISEVGYFLSPSELERTAERVQESLEPGGVLVLVHWRHPVAGWVLDADAVHATFSGAPGLPPVAARYRDRDVEIVVHAHDDSWPEPTR